MISEWFQRVGSSVPRGFSRYFILELLKEKTYTGKEIIDYAIEPVSYTHLTLPTTPYV